MLNWQMICSPALSDLDNQTANNCQILTVFSDVLTLWKLDDFKNVLTISCQQMTCGYRKFFEIAPSSQNLLPRKFGYQKKYHLGPYSRTLEA